MTSSPDSIARAVLQRFHGLPAKRKPLVRDNGVPEWVPLCGIVAERNGDLTCLALATGMKCLPASKLKESNGNGIHDWHAEILAFRTLNRFLLDECRKLQENAVESSVIQRRCRPSDSDEDELGFRPFGIRDDVRLHMYCSEAPCGDASMELTMAAQDDDSPWKTPDTAPLAPSGRSQVLRGRADFSKLGTVRTKPARRDAPDTLSKSCSDKIALKQCTSVLSSMTALFLDPANAYIYSLILPESQYSSTGCRRAFSADGRMKPLAGKQWPGGYSFNPFRVETTKLEFEHSKRSVQARSEKIAASNLAAAWSLSGVEETIIGGVIQGRKRFKEDGASQMSKRRMWESAVELSDSIGSGETELSKHLQTDSYKDVKRSPLLADRQRSKDEARQTALAVWDRNEEGEGFGIVRGNH